jgi:hypothetical protein
MQLIQRQTLLYQEGRSDKIYEVDLCQISEGRYVVNFRYGKRGSTLREGVETVASVPLAEGQKIFERAVNAKLRKGYRDVTGLAASEIAPVAPEAAPQPSIEIPAGSDPRHQAILQKLAVAVSAGRSPAERSAPSIVRPLKPRKSWSTTRVIWRAGELHLQAAAPLLVQLLGDDPLTNYSIVWALGQCGDASVVGTLETLYRQSSTTDTVRRIALEAIFKLADSSKRAELVAELLNTLPPELAALASTGPAETFTSALRAYLDRSSYQQFAIIDTLYHINSETIRPALLEIARTAPLRPNYFQRLRHLFKIAEYRHDAELFGILAYRFEQDPALYNSSHGYALLSNGQHVQCRNWNYNSVKRCYEATINPEFERELRHPDTDFAYSSATRDYLRRRVWRILKQLGEFGDPAYVRLATELLLPYTDANAGSSRESVHYRWDQSYRRQEASRINWDTYAGYLAFGHVLYENSPRYTLKSSGKAWRCKSPYKPGDPEPAVREEAFPQLWQQQPESLLRLLLQSHCLPVHQFAVKALRACSTFCTELALDMLVQLLGCPYETTARFSFELAQQRYQPEQPNSALILAIANCAYAPARAQAYEWITAQRDRFLADSLLIAGLVTSTQLETRQFARRLLQTALLSESAAKALVGQIIAAILTFNADQSEVAPDITETVLVCFASQLRSLGLEIVLDLLRHPLVEVQTLGARILLNHQTPAVELPAGLIDALLTSPYEPVRVIGVQLLGQLPDQRLMAQSELLLALVTHELPEMREAIRAGIRRLTAHNPEFAQHLVNQLLTILLTTEPHEGVHAFLAKLLRTDIPDWMPSVNAALTWQLLQQPATAVQELAGCLLQANAQHWLNAMTILQMVQLTDHEVQTVREAGQQMLRQIVSQTHQRETSSTDANLLASNLDEANMLEMVAVLESKWPDSHQFGQQLFEQLLPAQDLTPAVVVSICDSNRPDVRKFGRDLLSRCLQTSDEQNYLIKFSEHPATDMQLFATQYLETSVTNNPQRLEELKPYFIRVLGQVNRGRVAKQRIFEFLNAEALKSRASAQIVAEILTRQSATIAIGEKAKAIATLLKIHQVYPDIPLPIQVKPVEVRCGV